MKCGRWREGKCYIPRAHRIKKKSPRQANQEIMIYSRIFIDSRSNFGNWKKTSRWRRAYSEVFYSIVYTARNDSKPNKFFHVVRNIIDSTLYWDQSYFWSMPVSSSADLTLICLYECVSLRKLIRWQSWLEFDLSIFYFLFYYYYHEVRLSCCFVHDWYLDCFSMSCLFYCFLKLKGIY